MSDERQNDEEDFPLEPPQKDWPRARGKECVVVAEDSEPLRDLILAMLSGLGYEVLTAAGGHEALRQIDRHHGVDLVITDAIMPRGGGFQIIDEMRGRYPGTPIVITSGFTEEIEAGLRERTGAALDAVAETVAEPAAEDPARETVETAETAVTAGPPLPLIEFLPKPFRPEQLARLVRDVLDRSRSDVPRKRG